MRSAATLLSAFAVCAALASCQNGQKGGSGGADDLYVSNYGNDGGYNPYPGQPGAIQSGSYVPPPSSTAAPTYQTPPAPQNDPYAFNAGSGGGSTASSTPRPSSSAPKRTTTTASSSTPKRTTTTANSSKPKPKASSTASAKKSGGGSYKVAGGDTLYGIAKKRGSTVAKIKAANNLSGDLIRPGQVLKIP